MWPCNLVMRSKLAWARIPASDRDTTAPSSVIELAGSWSFLSDVLNPSNLHSSLNAQKLDFASSALSAQ